MSQVLSKVPVLRVLVPFMAGILLHRLWHCWWAPLVLILISVAAYLMISMASRSVEGRWKWRSVFIVPLSVIALSLGWLAAIIHCPPRLQPGQADCKVLMGRVIDLQYTDFSMRMTVELLDNDLPPCKLMVSTRGCDYTMQTGDLIAWQGQLVEITSLGNPDEMDYASYLLDNKGIRYTQHLPVGQVKKVGHSPTLLTRLANVRRGLCLMVFSSQLSPATQQFVAALLLGDSSLIDKATRQEFSSAGVAHVLALSGLHVGFIALIIWWLLFPLDYLRLKKLRLAITLAAIALFAVFTGLSPSVVRSTVMIGMVFASMVFYRRSVSINALALAALCILVFSPSALYSVGFQLSFITVGAILLFARLPQRLESRHKWVNSLTSTVITSLVAMLATIALSAHYFHTISLMSVLANLLILPILPVFMVLGALFLLVSAAGLHWPVLDWVLDVIYRYISWVREAVNAIPLSHLGGVYVSTFGVIAYFVIMALIVLWLYRRNYRYLLAAGIALTILLGHSLWVDFRTPRRGLVVFNSFSSTPLLYYDNGQGYVWIPDEEDTDSIAFSRYYAGFLAHYGIDQLRFFTGSDTLRLDEAMIRPPYAYLMGRRIVAVGPGKWKHLTTEHPTTVDDIIITKRYHGTAAKLQELYRFDRFIISGAMHDASPILHECDSLNINHINLATHGAITTYF
ncbi:MAG: ComEC/Rec2 family competence protein [Muribaculaceae bacterium]|nr:ComEC/Rec2 family competence protein [Muribaculaceae bacterium]